MMLIVFQSQGTNLLSLEKTKLKIYFLKEKNKKLNNTDEIEFSHVRKLVAHYAVSPEAKEKILAQPLANKLVKANALLDETEEMVWILDHGLHIPFINSDAFTQLSIK